MTADAASTILDELTRTLPPTAAFEVLAPARLAEPPFVAARAELAPRLEHDPTLVKLSVVLVLATLDRLADAEAVLLAAAGQAARHRVNLFPLPAAADGRARCLAAYTRRTPAREPPAERAPPGERVRRGPD